MTERLTSGCWMRVAQLGHREIWGYGTEVEALGSKFLHVRTPEIEGRPSIERLIAAGSIYEIEFSSEEACRQRYDLASWSES